MQLASTALPSIQSQTDRNFEWIVINDGANPDTKDIINSIKTISDFPISYIEMEHPLPSSGFGLCYARNLGLDAASGNIVSYLDDDNSIAPEFVASMRQYFKQHPNIRYSIAKQQRRRDVIRNGSIVRQGKSFVSPSNCCSLQQLLWQQQIFDSNGFVHYRSNAGRWNPQFKVFADYEYLLQSACIWGESGFGFNDNILVNYIQSSSGIIGSSSYEQWASELLLIVANADNYLVLQDNAIERLEQLADTYSTKAQISSTPKAFTVLPI
ncbi:MAG: glycosyltransferase family 2 protein [Gloeotrichia echinulata HAB0833]